MKTLAIPSAARSLSSHHVIVRAASGSLLLHALAIGVLVFLGGQAKPLPMLPAIEIELGFAPLMQRAMPSRQEATATPQKSMHREKARPPRHLPLTSPNPGSEALAAPPVDKPATGKNDLAANASTDTASHAGAASTPPGNSLPYVVYGPRPMYPLEARANGREGKVRIKVLISERGNPGEVHLAESSGYASLDEAALNALQHWRFQPARRDGLPVQAWVTVPVMFSLR